MTHLKFLLKKPACLLATVLAATFLIGNWLLVKSQNPTTPATLQGQTQTVTLRPWGTVHAGRINYSLDTDHDGMPDDVELANGLDPNNPADADGDLDGDGLTNGDEVTLGTGLQTLDSDGDGVSDAEEVRQGYNPLDATNTPPTGTQVVSLQVSPTRLGLSLNTLLGNIPAQLTVTGMLSDGSTVDLTRSPGTSYQSLDSAIATIDGQGSAVGIAPGTTTIQVRNGLLTTETNVVVTNFTPGPVATIPMPGFANNVDVSGNFAYVACGAAGLQVVDATNPAEASIAASLELPGNANDVRVVGTLAYVAAGDGGLQIADISDPFNPQLAGSIEFGGAVDIVVEGNSAYVASEADGLKIIDISNPANPIVVGSFSLANPPSGIAVDVARNLAVLTVPQTGVQLVDITNPAFPQARGTLSPVDQGLLNPRDVAIVQTRAYVVAYDNPPIGFPPGLYAIDISNPDTPQIVGTDSNGFLGSDFEVLNQIGVAAAQGSGNAAAALFSHSSTSPLLYVGAIRTSINYREGTGIALTENLIFETVRHARGVENGESGDSGLVIVQYSQPPDTSGVAPTVSISSPADGEGFVSGDQILVKATALDDAGVALVELKADGVIFATLTSPPYQASYIVPASAQSITFEATAYDYAANRSDSTLVMTLVVADPLTTAVGQVVDSQSIPFVNAMVTVTGTQLSAVTDGQGFFSIPGVGTIPLGVEISVTIASELGEKIGKSLSVQTQRGGFTNLGTIYISPPVVEVTSPSANATVIKGETLPITVSVMSGRQITGVEVQANGQVIGSLTAPPYRVNYQVPQTESVIRIEARAVDDGGNHGRATPISIQVVETDPLTTVIGTVTDVQGTPVPTVPVVLDGLGLIAVTDALGQFRFENISTVPFGVKLSATINDTATGRRGRSAQVAAVRGGTTDLGTIQAAVIRSALLPSLISGLGSGDHTGDNLADVFIGFADQPAAVYQSDGTGNLTPGSTLTLPFSMVRAGTSLQLDSTGGADILAQPVGTPGTATIVLTDGAGGILNSIPLETGLDRDSELIVAGFDSPDFFSRRPVVAFAALTGGTSITVRVNQGAPDQFSAPIVLPTTPEIPIRSLLVQDVTGDRLADIVGIEEISSTDTRLIVFPRTGTTTFGAPIESSVIIRNGAATVGTADITIASFGSGRGDDIAVLGDDRVRIYSGDGSGSYTLYREILLPENTIARGIGPQSRQLDGPTVLAITVSQLDAPLSRILLLYDESGETPHTVVPYDISSDVGETRIVIDELGGSEFRQFDVVVIDGRTLTTFFDIGPPRPSE